MKVIFRIWVFLLYTHLFPVFKKQSPFPACVGIGWHIDLHTNENEKEQNQYTTEALSHQAETLICALLPTSSESKWEGKWDPRGFVWELLGATSHGGSEVRFPLNRFFMSWWQLPECDANPMSHVTPASITWANPQLLNDTCGIVWRCRLKLPCQQSFKMHCLYSRSGFLLQPMKGIPNHSSSSLPQQCDFKSTRS